jgi:transcriptional regulator with XRE-family HTH domain
MENIVRKLRGNMTQAELAELTGLSQNAICKYEQGRFPKPETLQKIAAAAGKQVSWVIEDLKEEEK